MNKRRVALGVVLMVALVSVVAFAMGGCAGAPTAVERKLFKVETNLEPVVELVANPVPVGVTNVGGVTSPVFETNRVWVTNMVETYTLTPNATAGAAVGVAGSAGSLLGPYGELVSVALGGLIGLWGLMRSHKANKTAAVLAQVIETGREVLRSTPQGAVAERQWKSWMIAHQAEQGVIEQVMRLVEMAVDSETAKGAAAKLVALMQETQGS